MARRDIIFLSVLAFLAGLTAAGNVLNFPTVLLGGFLFFIALGGRLGGPRRGVCFLLFLCAGFWYYHLFFAYRAEQRELPATGERWQAEITAAERRESYTLATGSLQPPYRGQIQMLLPRYPDRKYGEVIAATEPILPAPDLTGLPFVRYPSVELLTDQGGNPLRRHLLGLREASISHFRQILPQAEAALLAGITFGARADFGEDLRQAMARSGTVHLVALSGYNIAVLINVLEKILRGFLPRKICFVALVSGIIGFVFLTALEPSIIRAALMGFLAVLALETGRLYDFRNSMVLAAAAMSLFSPTLIVRDLGFQLSFLSLLGIAYLAPRLAAMVRWTDHLAGNGWRAIILLTMAAQLAVWPVLVLAFGSFSLSAPLANLLILPLIPLTMGFGFLFAVAAWFLPLLDFFGAAIGRLVLGYELQVVRILGQPNWVMNVGALSVSAAVVYYGALGYWLFRSPKISPVAIPLEQQ